MIKNKHVTFYMDQYKRGEIKVSKYIVLLFKLLETTVLNRTDLYFDTDLHDKYVAFTKKNYFELNPFQTFITAFVFLYYKEDDNPFYEQFFIYLARGAGKNGLISSLVHFFTTEFHGVERYNVSIVANSEAQAKTSFDEIHEVIDGHGKGSAMQSLFYHSKTEIMSRKTRSSIQYHTSNARTKDSLRDGCVIYDEVHEYDDSRIVDVFSSGLGKVKHAREFFITTDGFVRGGYLDDLKERAENILKGEAPDDRMFVFMATLDDDEEMDDFDCWQKANPMFHEPMSDYAKTLFRKVKSQYVALGNSKPSARIRFMTKRMNLPATDLETSVATWQEIEATNRELIEMDGRSCVGGLDYASVRDFAAVGLLFKDGEDYHWITHSFVNKNFLKTVDMKAPIEDWEREGLLTIVDEPVISINHIVDWFVAMRIQYGLTTIVGDNYRLQLVKDALNDAGFEVMYVRTKGIEAMLAPIVETLFAEKRVVFGDNPLMRWYTNNVKVIIDTKGNRTYGKKDEVRRKTDGFQAFIHALYRQDLIAEESDFILGNISF